MEVFELDCQVVGVFANFEGFRPEAILFQRMANS